MSLISKRHYRRYPQPFFYKIRGNPRSHFPPDVFAYYAGLCGYDIMKLAFRFASTFPKFSKVR